jgi:hypothetical protein
MSCPTRGLRALTRGWSESACKSSKERRTESFQHFRGRLGNEHNRAALRRCACPANPKKHRVTRLDTLVFDQYARFQIISPPVRAVRVLFQ